MKDAYEEIIIAIVAVVVILGGALGIRACQAKYIYHDMRCMWAECRISK